MNNICGTRLPTKTPPHTDNFGCLKTDCNGDVHVFRDQNGMLIEWYEDMSCTCGCWDAYEDGDTEVCLIYQQVEREDL